MGIRECLFIERLASGKESMASPPTPQEGACQTQRLLFKRKY